MRPAAGGLGAGRQPAHGPAAGAGGAGRPRGSSCARPPRPTAATRRPATVSVRRHRPAPGHRARVGGVRARRGAPGTGGVGPARPAHHLAAGARGQRRAGQVGPGDGGRDLGAAGDLRGSGRRRGGAPPALRDPAGEQPALGHPAGLAAARHAVRRRSEGVRRPRGAGAGGPADAAAGAGADLPGAAAGGDRGRVAGAGPGAAAPPAVGQLGRLRRRPLRGRGRGRHRAQRVRPGHAAAGAAAAGPARSF